MNRRSFGVSLLGAAAPSVLCAQRRQQRTEVVTKPPLAATEAEKRILSVLDQMSSAGALYLAVDANDGRMLRLLAETSGTRRAIEIGTSTGYSALWLSLALHKTRGTLTTFEIDDARAAQARRHFDQAGVNTFVNVEVGDAHEMVKRLKDPIDLLFLDADKEGYASYLQTLLPLVRSGGLITADNVTMAPDYVSAVTTNPNLDTVFFGRFGVTLKKL